MASILQGLVFALILEALLIFLAPSAWRKTYFELAKLKDGQLRFLGLVVLVLGCLIASAMDAF